MFSIIFQNHLISIFTSSRNKTAKMEMNEIQAESLIPHPESTTSKLDGNFIHAPATTDDIERGKNEAGWGSMIANFLKILIFGACVFWYDMTSKF